MIRVVLSLPQVRAAVSALDYALADDELARTIFGSAPSVAAARRALAVLRRRARWN